ncbi:MULTISPECIES: 5-carboxymethyl-2-hydroxymuconate Delta-isomerase [unclassified Sphingomonas]|uniref:5-carboxymethyl-2-hydroxymuconate Delta-isomerase n=1 Tax=unclassified Sphingomonas TaxID=196159 RepID=UPI000926A438|nr:MULTISPECIES: 5-carboxymethyl-2-hydroxymuconate Delta-isomerase [unclassified Sphingomonas]MBN8847018.1 5-carboxymethyl-2-hydroxymuconate Delta-isomerase [Sphingomonas sp.]OJV33119.1 MAG: 5-carboxymethyl-2-hydroxymuconate isomerase [Sphingomonas sp. 67-36]
MAHATVEWTANLEGEFDLPGLLALIAAEMRERSGGVFPVGGIRVRAIRLTDYVIADGKGPDDAFINIDVKMGAGRDAAFRKAFFDQMFAAVKSFLGDLFERRPLALSLYVEEAEGWKHNTIHQRLAAKK